ncbi:hypothetical protein ACOJIU_15405 [Carnobacterium maltaromaticum]|uniref:hypothetical protein n=1 Tax=Carnobacterium maltaromaticum TaxID=2751 RepID=UPI003B97F9C8
MTEKNFFELRAFPGETDRYNYFFKNNMVAIDWGNTEDVSKMNIDEIEDKLKLLYPDENTITISQRKNVLHRFKSFNVDDILLIPYKKGKKITIAKVTKEYSYEKSDLEKHMAHQVGIKVIKTVSEDDLSESLNNTLKARLTLTKISKDKHAEILHLIDRTKYSKNVLAYLENIEQIHQVFKKSEEPLVKKALLFSAYSLCESYLTEHINLKINLCDTKSMNSIEKIIHEKGKNKIEQSLKYYSDRKKSFKEIYGANLEFPTQAQQHLRNSLAHDITSPYIEDDTIYFTIKGKSKTENESIENLFKEFKNFTQKLNKIAEKNKN